MDIVTIKRHFQTADPILYRAIQEVELEPREFLFAGDHFFHRLVEDIISQQLSVKVARVIMGRFMTLFAGSEITPATILATPDDKLRKIGMSWAKVKYVKDLAQKTLDGTLQFSNFQTWDDEAIIEHLIQVKGIGRWTAEMFLMFTLGKPDVFSIGDLGLIRAMQKVYGLSELEIRQRGIEIASNWSPYRTYACWALWKILDTA